MQTHQRAGGTLVLAAGVLGLWAGAAAGWPAPPVGPGDRRPAARAAQEAAKLVRQLADDEYEVRDRAARRLVALGGPARPALREALRDKDVDVRLRAAVILAQIRATPAVLLEELRDADPAVRRQAAAALAELGDKGKVALPALVLLVKDRDAAVRQAALDALLVLDPTNKAVAGHCPPKAHANGKYARLLRKIRVPQDRASYGDYRDYGHSATPEWHGHKGIPTGYWVYVYPDWYIWAEQKKP
jgi:hypothetical protein